MVQDAYQLSIIICFNTEYNISIVTSTVKFDAEMLRVYLCKDVDFKHILDYMLYGCSVVTSCLPSVRV
jgi:hypothetical protein